MIITQLYSTINIALPTRVPTVHTYVSDSMLPPPPRPSASGRRLPNASLIWLAGGTPGGSVELSVTP